MHVCLRSLRGEREFAQALFFERVREATDSHDVLQPQEDQVEGDVVEGVAAELSVPAGLGPIPVPRGRTDGRGRARWGW